MTWVLILLNFLVIAPFLWTLLSPGNGPDGAAEASFTFFMGVFGTVIIWVSFGAWLLFIWFLDMFQT
jgi:hypothetical protein